MNFFTTDDGQNLAYRIDGADDAPAIILIHSLGTDLHMWDRLTALLSRDLRVIRYDFRGHGASAVPPGPYTLERSGLDLLALFDTLHLQQAHICGNSQGALIALWFSIHYPERVNRAIFANTGARIGSEESWDARINAVKAGGMQEIQEAVLGRFLSASFRANNPEVTHQIREMLVTTNPSGYIANCMVLRNSDLRGEISTISVPSLIIAGVHDESTPPALSDELHAAIAGSHLLVLDAAHLSSVEKPQEWDEALLTFLERHVP